MLVTCFSTARSVTTIRSAMPVLERPSAISSSTSRSRGVSSASGSSRRWRPTSWLTTPGSTALPPSPARIPRPPPLPHPPHRRGELVDIRHAILQQVADTLTRLRQQLHRIPRLHVLAQHQHPHLRIPLTDPLRRTQPLIRMRRRHPDIHDRHIRLGKPPPPHQILRIINLPNHLKPRIHQQPRHTLPQQHRIIRQHYSHGITDDTQVPEPLLRTASIPSRASTRSASPRRPVPPSGSAPPTPSSETSIVALPSKRMIRTVACLALAYLATFVSASATT